MDETGQPGAPTPGEHGNGAGPHGDPARPARPANGWAADPGWSGAETGVDPSGRPWHQAVEPVASRGWADHAAYSPRPLPASPAIPIRELRQPVNGVHLGEAPEPERGWSGGPGYPYEPEGGEVTGRQGAAGPDPSSGARPDHLVQPGTLPAGEPDPSGTARHAFGDPGWAEPERTGIGSANQPPRWAEPAQPAHPGPISAPPVAVSGPPSATPVPPVVASGPPAAVSGPPAVAGSSIGAPGQLGGQALPEHLVAADFERGRGFRSPSEPEQPPVTEMTALMPAVPRQQDRSPAPPPGPEQTGPGWRPAEADERGPAPVHPADLRAQEPANWSSGWAPPWAPTPEPESGRRPESQYTAEAVAPAESPREPDPAGREQRWSPSWADQSAQRVAEPPTGPVAREQAALPLAGPGFAAGPATTARNAATAPETATRRATASEHTGYPGEHISYPGEHTGYPSEHSNHPGEHTGYPSEHSNHPGEQPGYPGERAGYPGPAAPGPEAPSYLSGPGGLSGPPGPEPSRHLAGPAFSGPGAEPAAPPPGPDPAAEQPGHPTAAAATPAADAAGRPAGPSGPSSAAEHVSYPSAAEQVSYPSAAEQVSYPSAAEHAGYPPVGQATGYPYRREALALPTGPSHPGAPYRYPEPVPAEPAPAARPADPGDVLPQRVPAEPDVPTVPEPPTVEPPAETPELARIATHLRREDGAAQLRERPDGFDVNAILDAVRGVAGVRDASLRTTPAGAHSLRLDLADGADPAEVSRHVARLLQERMGLAAAPQNLPTGPASAPPSFAGTAAPPRPRPAPPRHAPPAEPEPRPEPAREEPRRRHQAPGHQAQGHRGRATVGEPATVAPGDGGRSGTALGANSSTVGSSYSGSPVTTTETAPSRPLNPGSPPGPRVIIDHVQVSTFGLDATVEVRLAAGKQPAAGLATGPAVDGYVLRLCAVAAAAAIDELLSASTRVTERGRCFVEHAAVVQFGSCEVATVVVLLVCDGWVEQLAGSALVSGDPRQAVVRATLAAVNRRLEALLT